MATDIKSKIDKLSGTDTMSRNITEALDKYTGSEKMSRNIAEAAAKLDQHESDESEEPEEPEQDTPTPTPQYTPSNDTEVDFTKTYYTEGANGAFEPVENPTGNPSEQGWYEPVN